MNKKTIKTALISVFHKDRIAEIAQKLTDLNVTILSTGGTFDYIKNLNINGLKLQTVEDLTTYPSILGGRVKTLHPKIFGGILARRENENDLKQLQEYQIPEIDLIIVDLYPFEKTVASTDNESEIIEKIDIGGISLIRGAAKNFNDVIIVPSAAQYDDLLELLNSKNGVSNLEDRRKFACYAFRVSSHYDTAIFNYFDRKEQISTLRISIDESRHLRYGENPHQEGRFYGDFDQMFEQFNGKEISYNNLIDIDAAVKLIDEFSNPAFAILKHNNACGMAVRKTIKQAYIDALAADPVSAYGGVLIANRCIDLETAEEVNQLFCEILIAPEYKPEALKLLKSKKNRILLKRKEFTIPAIQYRSVLTGVLVQDYDNKTAKEAALKVITKKVPTTTEMDELLFAEILVKHTKSNAIVLTKNHQLLASGTGQTSRVDALRQAIAKAQSFNFNLKGAVMASDAFFPFPDCVEIAHQVGIDTVIQPGGSIRDNEVIDFCNEHGIAMVATGMRHFRH